MDSSTDSMATGAKSDDTDMSSGKVSKRGHEKDEDLVSEKASRVFARNKDGERGKEREVDRARDSTHGDLDRGAGASGIGRVDSYRGVGLSGLSHSHSDRGAAASAACDEDDDGLGALRQNFVSASSAIHGLLQKLGTGLDDLLPGSNASSHQNRSFQKILSGLRAEGEEARQLEALSQLCELLSIGTKDSLSSFSVQSFVPVLVGLLNHESNADMMLLAARALTHLCDVLPSSCTVVVHYGAVPSFCARLLAIEYIDLAEQSLQALEKISHGHPTACLRAGALIAVLSYLDFFPTGVQRVAVSTAANICRQLPEDAADFVMEAVPILTNLLLYTDFKVVENASVCLTRIADAFVKSSDKIDKLCSYGLISQAVHLVSVSCSGGSVGPHTSLSTSTYTDLIRLLSICVSGSAAAAESLLLLDISTVIKDALTGAGLISSTSVSASSMNRPSDQLYEIVSLINELLPPISEVKVGTGAANSQRLDGTLCVDVSSREKLLQEQPEVLLQFGTNLFPALVQVYSSSVNSPVCNKCLAAVHKLVYFSTAEMLFILLKESNVASFLAAVLASKDPSVLLTALQISELLMQKLPSIFFRMFVKEGVIYAIDALIASDKAAASAVTSSSTVKKKDLSSNRNADAQPPRLRRNVSGRRHSSGYANDMGTEGPGAACRSPAGSFPSVTSLEPASNALCSGILASAIETAVTFKETYFSESSGIRAPLNNFRPSTRSRSSMLAANPYAPGGRRELGGAPGSSKGKGEMGSTNSNVAHNHFEHKGPETRNAAARRRAAAAGTFLFDRSQAGVGGVLEEVEFSMSPVEVEEAIAMEEDESFEDGDDDEDDYHDHDEVFGEEPAEVCIGERVHDVQVGDAVEIGAVPPISAATSETPIQPSLFCAGLTGVNLDGRGDVFISGVEASGSRTGAAFGSRGALPFAAATAGVTSPGVQSVRAGRDRRSIAAISTSNAPPRLVFYLNGRQLDRSLTIFQAIHGQAVTDANNERKYAAADQQFGGVRRLWDAIYTITYQRIDPSAEKAGPSGTTEDRKLRMTSENRVTAIGTGKPVIERSWQQTSLLDGILQQELPCDWDKSNSTYHILSLLRVLESLNRRAPRLRDQIASDSFVNGKIKTFSEMKIFGPLVPQEEFLSSKLTAKLACQMQDALALCSDSLPSWCHQLTRGFPFLFPFETRRQYFYSTAFGLSRALQWLQQQRSADGPAPSNERELRVGRLRRQKVRVSRNQILDAATKVMEMYCGNKAVLEVEYFGEVGTGLGPTLEFYTLLSHELQKSSLLLWRSGSDNPNIGSSPRDTEMCDAESEAMDDCSTMPDSSTSQQNEVTVEYVNAPGGLFPRPWHPNSDCSSMGSYAKVIEHFRLLGCTVAQALQDGHLLDLPLSVAFYRLALGQELDLFDIKSIDLEHGSSLQEMQMLVQRKQYLDALSEPTNDLSFHDSRIEDLCLDFTLPGYPEYELVQNGSNVMVTLQNLEEYLSLVVDATLSTGIAAQMEAFRTGFNQVFPLSSLQIFNEEELDYLLCGCHELWTHPTAMSGTNNVMATTPPGAVSALGTFLADGDLPSVMTCANYLKLPPYSCKEVMRERLLYAISEGQGSFHLS